MFAGWPQIADPQSLVFSPLHFLLALFDRAPGFRSADAVVFAALFVGGVGFILFFRDRSWHVGGAVAAALAFAFGGAATARIQHVGEVLSLSYLPIAIWLLARALDRSSRWYGLAAGLAARHQSVPALHRHVGTRLGRRTGRRPRGRGRLTAS